MTPASELSGLHPRLIASKHPHKTALLFPHSGKQVSYSELECNINRCANLLHEIGMRRGDVLAVSMGNTSLFIELCWAAINSGLYFVPISPLLQPAELTYLIENSGANAFFCDATFTEQKAQSLSAIPSLKHCFSHGLALENFKDISLALTEEMTTPLTDEVRGEVMMYSSGTTGKPKGIKPKANYGSIFDAHKTQQLLIQLYQFNNHSIYLSTAPFYHAAPLKFILAMNMAGGTVIVMEHFEAQKSLEIIDEFQVTHSQWVPTMFIRLLKLPSAIKNSVDCRSLKFAIHAAAPCPEKIKRQMLEWWGPVVYEYYGGSEGIGMCAIGPDEWLRRPGSVGRSVRGEIHILDKDNVELPDQQIGTIYFSGGRDFSYHKDPLKTAEATNDKGWRTMGDLGYVDEEGYLYLADRRDNLIISGGVNIYPREIEDLLITHPKVYDVAVIGVPCKEFGQQVKAIVRLENLSEPTRPVEEELIAFCRIHLARFKCPKRFSFVSKLPRQANGKLLKRLLN